MAEAAAQMLGAEADSILFEGGFAFSKGSPGKTLSLDQLAHFLDEKGMSRKHEGNFVWQDYQDADAEGSETTEKRPNILYGYNAGLAEVEVNVETGEVRVLKVVNATDAGTVVNPQALEGQAEGGVVMGIGIALREGFHPERPANFKAYGLPTTKDMPTELTPLFVGEPYAPGPFGAKSAGEMPILSPMPSILNAIENATDARVYEIPATPDRVLAALARKEPV
jgi:CO/xanthine dehydrogenase Mo-binding subunit